MLYAEENTITISLKCYTKFKSQEKKYKVPDRYPVGLWGKKEEIFNRAHFLKKLQEFEKNTKSSVETGVQSGTGHTPPLSYSSSFSNFSVRLSLGALKRQQKLEKYKLP